MVKKTSRFPGMRFYPTDVELIKFYLKRKIMGKRLPEVIAEVNIYKFSPWDLPDKALLKTGDLEWLFFCPKEMKYGTGIRFNRAVEGGYWKSTGRDRPVRQDEAAVGMIKTLVFHIGQAPKGDRTNWVIHEYRIVDPLLAEAGFIQDAYVLCKLFQKSGSGPKNGEQHGAPFKEEEWDSDDEGDDPLLAYYKISEKVLPEVQRGECSGYATTEVPLPEPAVQTFVEDDSLTVMMGNFTAEMPGGNETSGGVVLEGPVLEDGNDIFSGLADLGDWRGFDEVSPSPLTVAYDHGLCLGLDDLKYPLEDSSAPSH
ncbi:NAC domain-containing protein 82-like [Impatiens glandulifera]|uniref:NAC domain-containing protein 82-like n=1 Tax=Impatiens glandulifera TaxID=253017 RepID=UPI001FB08837|nr:NAC domain-containing protein 82-like [Impatiens glandulifera]